MSIVMSVIMNKIKCKRRRKYILVVWLQSTRQKPAIICFIWLCQQYKILELRNIVNLLHKYVQNIRSLLNFSFLPVFLCLLQVPDDSGAWEDLFLMFFKAISAHVFTEARDSILWALYCLSVLSWNHYQVLSFYLLALQFQFHFC